MLRTKIYRGHYYIIVKLIAKAEESWRILGTQFSVEVPRLGIGMMISYHM